MSYNTELQSNNSDLQDILDAVNELPEAGSGTVTDEQIAAAVEAYMEANPVVGQPGKDGEDGADGVTPEFSIGTVETLEAGSDATASITGTPEKPVLNLGIPKGADGEGGTAPTWKKVYECSNVEVAEAVTVIEIDLGGELGDISEFAIHWNNSKTTLDTACKGQMKFHLDGVGIGYYCFNIDHSTYANNLDIWADLGRKTFYKLGGINSTMYNIYTPYYQRFMGDHNVASRNGKLKVTFPAEWAGTYGVEIYTK